jgi:hypothetical protein
MPARSPSIYPPPVNRLRTAATRLAAELDEARIYQAAAYVSMAVDAVERSAGEEAHAEKMRTDVECEFQLDEHGRVWMIREGDCHIIGRTGAVCAEMRRFLAGVVLGDDRSAPATPPRPRPG